jgi:ADP-heptose:LPS heptosyltransferase
MLSVGGRKVNENTAPVILILFPGSLGDFCCVLPALQALCRSSNVGKGNLVARPELLAIAQRFPFFHRTISLDSGVIAKLFSSPPVAKEELSGYFAPPSCVVSWFGHTRPEIAANLDLLAPGHVRSFAFFSGQEECHASAYYLRCVGITELQCPSLVLREQDRSWVERYWISREWSLSSRVLVLHPGSGGKRKRWVGEGFAAVARWWQDQRQGKVLVLLGPAEAQEESYWRQVGEVEKDLAVLQVAALLSRADLYLGNDSGVSHLAGAVGARGVVLFGPTQPSQWRPIGGSLSVLYNVHYRAEAPQAQGITLNEVAPEEVITKLLQQGG